MRGLTLAATLAALAVSGVANAQPAQAPKNGSCFFVNQFDTWRAPDSKTVFIRVDVNRYYRLDMANACPTLLWPNAHLIMNVRGPNTICSAIDWDLKVGNGPPGAPEPCIVKTMTQLSPAEVAAIPPKFKP